jgi:hypothetical protein
MRRFTAILLLRNSTAKSTKRHEKGKRAAFKYRENTQILKKFNRKGHEGFG